MKILLLGFFVIGICGINAAGFAATTETLTLETYYPAPYGDYDRVTVSSNIGIGTTNPGDYELYVTGELYALDGFKPGGGPWTDSSDIRLKKNIKPISQPLDKLLQLKGIEFEWDEAEHARLLPGPQIGMIAQDVEKVFPQWISADKDGYKLLTVRGMDALVIESIRQIKAEIDNLKTENSQLKEKIIALEQKNNKKKILSKVL